jgi:hypothetical protein
MDSELIGNATVEDVSIVRGANVLRGGMFYAPGTARGRVLGEKFLGECLSGMTLRG